jgi:hypothetical protein
LLYGINKTNANLVRYEFGSQTLTTVGEVHDSGGTVMTDVRASVLFPGFRKMFVLWNNPTDAKNKLVYVDVITGLGTIVNSDVEGGKFTGAAGAATSDSPYSVFAIQVAKIKPPVTIDGLANINPNNSDANEFKLVEDTGGSFTRDDLKDATITDPNGTYYEGGATLVHLKPKGNGDQNALNIDGKAYALQNSNTYDFAGSMQVRVYNDQIKNSKAMGHWYIQIVSGTVTVNNDVQVLTPNRISKIDQRTGTVTELMTLSREYSGLGTSDGRVFYTTSGSDLYKIDTLLLSETKVGTMSAGSVPDLEFVAGALEAYNGPQQLLSPTNPADGQAAGATSNPGLGDLGTFSFIPLANDPVLNGNACD